MLRCSLAFFVACLVQQATALAQVAMPKADNLAFLEADHRTALRSEMATAVVGSLGEVVRPLRQDPAAIAAVVHDVVYGSLMLLTVNPEAFAKDFDVWAAAQCAVERAVEAQQMIPREVRVSLAWLAVYPRVVRVDFQVAFDSPRDRQAFIHSVVTDGGRNVTGMMCAGVPSRFKGRCVQPAESLLQLDDGDFALSLVGSNSDEEVGAALSAKPQCYGTVTVTPQGSAESSLKDPQWQEAVAISIAEMARVSRLQVGTLMSAAAPAVRVDFWLSRRTAACSQAAIRRVMMASITHLANWQMYRWRAASKDGAEFSVYGRLTLEVPDRKLFAANRSVEEAVQRAVWQTAKDHGPEARLSVKRANASLAAVGNLSDSVRVGFRVDFTSPSDRQIFYVDFAHDMGKRLLNAINKEVRACRGRCRLPRHGQGELDERYGTFTMWHHDPPRLVSDPLVQDAMALAISQIASVPYQQVGILLVVQFSVEVDINFWVTERDARLRQAAIQRMESAGTSKFLRCTLAHLDRLHDNFRSSDHVGTVFVSIVLQVPDARSFANSRAVLAALRGAVAKLDALPSQQVPGEWDFTIRSNLWPETLQLVRVDIRVSVGTQGLAKNFTRALAGDGGVKLVRCINELAPEPFKGLCRLPLQDQPKAAMTATSTAQAGNVTLSPEQPYGTMLLRTFSSEVFVWDHMEEAVATTIAEVALVPRSQVGLMTTRLSPVLLSIDFWVTSANATLRQVAVQRVNRDWADKHLKLVWQRRGRNADFPIFMVGGGTLLNGPGRYSCDGPGV